VLLASTLCFGGGTSINTGNATLINNTGLTINDLHVTLDNPAGLGLSSPQFSTVSSSDQISWDLSGGVVSPGGTVDLHWSDNFFFLNVPQLQSYYWTVDGVQQGASQTPLRLDGSVLSIPIFSPWTVGNNMANSGAGPQDYNALTIINLDDGTHVVDNQAGTIPGGSSVQVASFDTNNGYTYEFFDVTTGASLSGQSSVGTPEPAGLALLSGGVLLIGCLRRRAGARR
jgi:adhesin HecA-like repeat protein